MQWNARTSMTNNIAAIIIDGLGGPTKVAQLFRCKQPSVSYWKATGIIPKARLQYLLDVPEYRKELKTLGVLEQAQAMREEQTPLPPVKKKKRKKVKKLVGRKGPKPGTRYRPRAGKKRKYVKRKTIIPVLWKDAKGTDKEYVGP